MPESVLENRRFQKSLFRIVSIPLVFLFITLAYFHFQNSYRDSLTKKITEADKARLLMTQLKGQLLLVDSGISHFVISGDKEYITEIQANHRNIQITSNQLFSHFSNQPEMGQELRNLLVNFDRYIMKFNDIFVTRPNGERMASDIKAQGLIEKYRHLFNDLIKTHENLLRRILLDRRSKVEKLADAIQTTFYLELIFILLIGFFIVFIIAGQLKKVVESYRKLLGKYETSLSELKESLKTKDLFLANMSHELRTPLGAITGFAELACEADDIKPEVKHHLQYIRRNGEHLLGLIDDLFDVSRLEADKLELHEERLDLVQLVRDVENDYSSRIVDQRVEVFTSMAASVPKNIKTDPLRLKQILSNLVGNAIKFSTPGSQVRVSFTFQGGELITDVIDEGIGIAKEHHNRIFDAFSQVETKHSREYGGAGLGLSISKKLAVALGGDLVLVSSEPGKGTHFRFQIPVEVIGDAVFQKSTLVSRSGGMIGEGVTEPATKKTFDFSGKQILLAEDSKENQILFKIFIESSNANLQIVDNGTDAVKKALNDNFDLVLMDIQMPGLDGYEAVKILRSSQYQKKIIALTAHTLKGEKEKCMNAGFDGYLTKPISQQDLLSAVEKNLT